jgi:membrane fusion protein, multidrug efflux system
MDVKKLGIGALAIAAIGGVYYYQKPAVAPQASASGAPAGGPPVSVTTASAVKKKLPSRVETVGSVQAIAQVTIRPRLDSQVMHVHVQDGAVVKEGDMLVTLDSRQLEAQLKQAEGQLAKNNASLEGAKRELSRVTDLFARDASSRKLLDDAKTKHAEFAAAVLADSAAIDNLKVQLSYTQIKAPISGRVGTMPLKMGSIVRQGEVGMSLGNIIQTSPIYVAFGVPQRRLAEVQAALAKNAVSVDVKPEGVEKNIAGKLTVIDNAVDAATGSVILRATFENKDEALWPGALVTVRLMMSDDDKIAIPSTAVQISQQGQFVFVVKEGAVSVRQITAGRTLDNETAIDKGLEAGEIVVTDGQMALRNGSKVTIRNAGAQNTGAPAQGVRPPAAPAKTGG